MKRSLFLLIGLLALLVFGCSSDDDNGTNGEEPPPPPARVVVDTMVIAPTMSAVDEATWNNVDSALVTIGAYPTTYGKDAVLGQQDVVVKAIVKADTLYIKVKWIDRVSNILDRYIRKHPDHRIWELVESSGDDIFSLILHAPDSIADSGSVDIWRWRSSKTAPGRMAEDSWLTSTTETLDPTLNSYVYRVNTFNSGAKSPTYMHKDSMNYTGPYLFIEDTATYPTLGADDNWPTNYKMPGYVIDSTIFNLPNRDSFSRWDVRAISHHDTVLAVYPDYTWTVVFERALSKVNAGEDLDLSGLDSVQMSIIGDNNSNTFYTRDSSGSAPFWLILKP